MRRVQRGRGQGGAHAGRFYSGAWRDRKPRHGIRMPRRVAHACKHGGVGMIRDAIGAACIAATLWGMPYIWHAMANLSVWRDECGAGVMLHGVGGYYFEKGACDE